MSGVVLAALVFVTGVAAHLVASHLRASPKPERILVLFMAATAGVYTLLYLAGRVPPLAPRAVSPAADFLTGLAALGFLVLGYVEFWSLIERSFSLRLKRLTEQGLLREERGRYRITERGRRWARVGGALKKLLAVGTGG